MKTRFLILSLLLAPALLTGPSSVVLTAFADGGSSPATCWASGWARPIPATAGRRSI